MEFVNFEIFLLLCSFLRRCSCSLWSLAAISSNRYISICYFKIYHFVYNSCTTCIIFPMIWGTCITVGSANLFGWGTHIFEPSFRICAYDYTATYSYTVFLTCIGFGVPLLILIFSYLKILQHANRAGKDIREITKRENNEVYHKLKYNDKRLLISILAIAIAFLVLWIPFITTLLCDRNSSFPPELRTIGIVLYHLHTCANSVLYASTNKNFRESCKVFMKLVCNRKNTKKKLDSPVSNKEFTRSEVISGMELTGYTFQSKRQ